MKKLILKFFLILSFLLNFNSYADIVYPYNKSVDEQYNFGISFLKTGDYFEAEQVFRIFVVTNPKHYLAGSAQYWYGETFRMRRLWIDAAQAYLDGYTNYLYGHQHAAMNMLKLGVSMYNILEEDQACEILLGVKKQYPDAKQSIIIKAETTAKRYECENVDNTLTSYEPEIIEYDAEFLIKSNQETETKITKENVDLEEEKENSRRKKKD